jgi:zinc protease
VRALAEKHYGPIPAQPAIAARNRPQEPDSAAPRTVTLADARVEQPALRRYYLVPSSTTARPGESATLDVLAHLLGSGTNSYLYRALVVDHPLAVSAGAWYQNTALDATQFAISASPRQGVTFAQLETAIDEVLTAVIANGVTPEELERAKTQLVAESIYARDSQSTLARWYGAALTTGQSLEDVLAWPERVRAVTSEQLREAARVWLTKERSVTGYLIKDTTAKREEKRS